MKKHIYRVTSFKRAGAFVLTVTFDDGSEQTIDFRPVLHGELYGPLRSSSLFDAVRLDSEAGTLVWPNGADFDPGTLHDWPECREELCARAVTWKTALETHRPPRRAVAERRTPYGAGQ